MLMIHVDQRVRRGNAGAQQAAVHERRMLIGMLLLLVGVGVRVRLPVVRRAHRARRVMEHERGHGRRCC